MTRKNKNIWDLKVGDIISFTYSKNNKTEIPVTRVEEKNWYSNGKHKWETIKLYSRFPDFKIIKK